MAKQTLSAPRVTLTETGRRFEAAQSAPGRRWIRRVVIAVACLVGLGLLGLFLLAYADYDIAGNGSPSTSARIRWVWLQGDHLHYAVHITQARVFDLCPCTRRLAAEQYRRAHFHALTPRQQAVAANSHPLTTAQWVDYFVGPFAVSLDWLHDGVSWLSGQRPSQQVMIDMGNYEFQPAEITVGRGTTVTWRNTDELGEAHWVVADSGQAAKFDSAPLEPDELFAYTFTDRGTFTYYCSLHGAPGQQGMSGVIVVH